MINGLMCCKTHFFLQKVTATGLKVRLPFMRKKLMLYNTHSIPEGKEPIPLLYRFLVGVQHMLATRKR